MAAVGFQHTRPDPPGVRSGKNCRIAMTQRCAVALLGLLALCPSRVSAQQTCEVELTRVYESGDFFQVLDRVEACLKATSDAGERARLLELEAKSFLAKDDTKGAEATVVRLLREEPEYATRLDDPGTYAQMVVRVRR